MIYLYNFIHMHRYDPKAGNFLHDLRIRHEPNIKLECYKT
jgi:hypothetical protein